MRPSSHHSSESVSPRTTLMRPASPSSHSDSPGNNGFYSSKRMRMSYEPQHRSSHHHYQPHSASTTPPPSGLGVSTGASSVTSRPRSPMIPLSMSMSAMMSTSMPPIATTPLERFDSRERERELERGPTSAGWGGGHHRHHHQPPSPYRSEYQGGGSPRDVGRPPVLPPPSSSSEQPPVLPRVFSTNREPTSAPAGWGRV